MPRCLFAVSGLFLLTTFGFADYVGAQQKAQPADESSFVVVADDSAPAPIPEQETTAKTADCCGCEEGLCNCGEHSWATWGCNTCQMLPHYAYFPPMHGYYYFRPYHHSHVAQQQQLVTTWGGDPRNPYANEIFQQLYNQPKSAIFEGPPIAQALDLQK